MSPEQARGAAGIDARADVFSLGCVLFECVARLPPFVADHVVAVLVKILFDEPPRLAQVSPHVSPRLDQLVAAMLAKDPVERPMRLHGERHDLEPIRTLPPVSRQPAGGTRPGSQSSRA